MSIYGEYVLLNGDGREYSVEVGRDEIVSLIDRVKDTIISLALTHMNICAVDSLEFVSESQYVCPICRQTHDMYQSATTRHLDGTLEKFVRWKLMQGDWLGMVYEYIAEVIGEIEPFSLIVVSRDPRSSEIVEHVADIMIKTFADNVLSNYGHQHVVYLAAHDTMLVYLREVRNGEYLLPRSVDDWKVEKETV